MKTTWFTIALVASHLLAASQQTLVKISGTKLAYPLFEQWVEGYKQTHAGVSFVIDSKLPADSSDIVIASYAVSPAEIKPDRQLVAVARYVQLPIVNSERKDLQALQEKGFTKDDLQAIYFSQSAPAADNESQHFTLYSREKPACATKAFASHFGRQTSDIKGVPVRGDDRDLLEAVKKDTSALSYNNLGFIYNLQTRQVTDGIAVVPIDINENGRIDEAEHFYNTLDQVISYAERSNGRKLAIADVNVLLQKQSNIAAKDFLAWVLQQGQTLTHQTGFLSLTETNAQDQLALVRSLSYNNDDLDTLYGKQN